MSAHRPVLWHDHHKVVAALDEAEQMARKMKFA